jgi:hypothetical protein
MLHPDTRTLMVLVLNQITSKFLVNCPSLKFVVTFVFHAQEFASGVGECEGKAYFSTFL